MIEVRNLNVELGGERIIENANLTVEPGEIVVLSGPNGGGKTTLLRTILGVIPNYIPGKVYGEVSIDGVDPRRDPEKIKRIVQGTQQDPVAQVVGPTVLAEAALTPSLWGMGRRDVLERAYHSMRLLGIHHLAGRPVHRLSSGELMKTALAGVLSVKPRYLLLDEPSSHLDTSSSKILSHLITELRKQGLGLLIASHDKNIHELADQCYTVNRRISDGCAEGPHLPKKHTVKQRNNGIVVEVRNLWVRYPGSDDWALKDVSLRVHEGEMIALLGPNGSGKTTLLLTLAKVLGPGKGQVTVKQDPALLPPDPLLLFSRGTLRDEAERMRLEPPAWAKPVLDKPLLRASGGEQRLAALALIVMSGKRLLLLDEPTIGLDPWNRRRITETILELNDIGYTIIFATHDAGLAMLADRVYEFMDGRVKEA